HAQPGSSNMGVTRLEVDPSWLVLRALKAVGLVQFINETMPNADDLREFNTATATVPTSKALVQAQLQSAERR
ncbi:MAG: hypothetical protein ACRD3W_04965, partial [Terriglobales bacterium]